jgi:hypothetical protein
VRCCCGSLGLATTPVIDQRDDLDGAGLGNDIHTTDWSLVMRSRLLAVNGTDGNQVIIDNEPTAAEVSAANAYELSEMDSWLKCDLTPLRFGGYPVTPQRPRYARFRSSLRNSSDAGPSSTISPVDRT